MHKNFTNPPNFPSNGKFFLIRCFECEPEYGRENYVPAVASGACAWCGWKPDPDDLASYVQEQEAKAAAHREAYRAAFNPPKEG